VCLSTGRDESAHHDSPPDSRSKRRVDQGACEVLDLLRRRCRTFSYQLDGTALVERPNAAHRHLQPVILCRPIFHRRHVRLPLPYQPSVCVVGVHALMVLHRCTGWGQSRVIQSYGDYLAEKIFVFKNIGYNGTYIQCPRVSYCPHAESDRWCADRLGERIPAKEARDKIMQQDKRGPICVCDASFRGHVPDTASV